MILKTLVTEAAPLDWHFADGHGISKFNNKPGVEGERFIFVLCCIGRTFYRVVFDLGREMETAPVLPHWSQGCRPRKRRETAMLARKSASWRLRVAGWSHAHHLHDAKNGFLSLSHESLHEKIQQRVPARFVAIVFQRIVNAVFNVFGIGGPITLLCREGVFPGDHAGPEMFNQTYQAAAEEAFQDFAAQSGTAHYLEGTCPFTKRVLNLGPSGFVDDLANMSIGRTRGELENEAQLEGACLRARLSPLGVVLNTTKEENVIVAVGPGSQQVRREFF